MQSKRVVIIGGGFAGVSAAVGAAATLRAAHQEQAVSVELVNPDPCMVIKPRLYESDLSGVRVPLSGVLEPIGVVHHRAAVAAIDTDRRCLVLDDGSEPLAYDQLVLAAGSQLPLPARAPVHCADSYAQALMLRRAVDALPERPDARLSAVVVGGGFTGLELVTELAGSLARAAAAAGRTRGPVTLVERSAEVGGGFGPHARRIIGQALDSLGVEVRTGVEVSAVEDGGVRLAGGTSIPADLVVWATGPRASTLTEEIPGEHDRAGRLIVDAHLRAGATGVWAAGDCACARVDANHTSIMCCQHAGPQGRLAGENAAAVAVGLAPRRYRQPLYLTCLALGEQGALLTCGFDRDAVLATGAEGQRLKSYINRALIYPPPQPDAQAILAIGTPAPPGPLTARLTAMALRSKRVRAKVSSALPDRAGAFAAREAELEVVHD